MRKMPQPFQTIFRYFISGIIAVLPLVVTVALVAWLSNFLITWLGPGTMIGRGLSAIGIQFAPNEQMPYFFGWIAVLAAIFAIGFFVDAITRKMAVKWFDTIIKKIPLIGPVYGTTRQFTDLINKNGDDKLQSMSPVYCRFGSAGGGVLVLALMPTPEEYEIDGNKYRVVIVPTAPVPFGGGMFFVPTADIFPAEMSIDALMAFYVSMGVSGKGQDAE